MASNRLKKGRYNVMVVLPDHTVSIDEIGFYAENPNLTEPITRNNYDTLEIQNGPPLTYKTNTILRAMTFQATLINTSSGVRGNKHEEVAQFIFNTLELIQKCVGVHKFTSIYIGSFNALIEVKLADFKPRSVVASFNISEVA
jgi:hypothetical protein